MDRSATIQLGSYQFFERLGEGGSGQVYRAVGPDGPVAVKILGPAADLRGDDAARARFAREITALGQVRHPGLVPLLDHGFDPELGPYLVLPLLAGATLREVVGGRALCPEAAVLLALPIACAAAALHRAGYVHRDLKPENVIGGPDGAVTVVDLGLAWRDGMTRHTDTGTAVGSVGYMAPEQIEGRAVGAAADVWALGILLYEWIAGKRPFARPRPSEEAAAALIGACPKLTAADRRVDEALSELVARCLAADPAARPTADEVAAALAATIDWADAADATALAAERAAAIAAPANYQARVAPLRVRRLERQIEDALAGGRPFAALSLCDRALAYAPDRAELTALVARAEAATAQAPPAASTTAAPAAPTSAAPPASTSAPQPVPTSAAPTVETPTPSHRQRTVMIASIVAVAIAAIGITAAIVVGVSRDRPSLGPHIEVRSEGNVSEGLGLAKDMLSLIDRAVTVDEKRAEQGLPAVTARPGRRPTTAAGWLELADTQPPAEAVVSVREALALQPTWKRALDRLCDVLTELDDPGADAACRARP